MSISQITGNCLGTLDITAQFAGMSKAQEFTMCPIKKGEMAKKVIIQSDTRIGEISLADGACTMSPSYKGGAYFHHLALAKPIPPLSAEDLQKLKQAVAKSAGISDVLGVVVDNSGASSVLI